MRRGLPLIIGRIREIEEIGRYLNTGDTWFQTFEFFEVSLTRVVVL